MPNNTTPSPAGVAWGSERGGATAKDSYVSSSGQSYMVFGGDLRGDVTQAGDANANSLSESSSVDVLVAGRGTDTSAGGGGADVIRGGAGNDVIGISIATFADINVGTGTDTRDWMG